MEKQRTYVGVMSVIACLIAAAGWIAAQSVTGVPNSTGNGAANVITAVNSSITASSLGAQAICALHTDTGCFNTVTDATAANCPAGTKTTTCLFPTTLTIPANTLGGKTASLDLTIGALATATVPTTFVEIYVDTTRIYAGIAAVGFAGARVTSFPCNLAVLGSGNSAPLEISCPANGALPPNGATPVGANSLLSDTTPAIAVDTTVSHTLSISISYSANTTGNKAWLYGMRFTY